MDATSRPSNYVTVGLASFIVLATINTTITSALSQQVVLLLRPLLALIIVGSIVANVLKRGLKVRGFLGMALYTVAAVYGIGLSMLTNSLGIVLESLFIDVPLTLSGIYLISAARSASNGRFIQDTQVKFFVCYAVVTLIVTAAVGGFIPGAPPQFNFEYGSSQIGQDQTYSLGLTNFYGLATIAAAFLTIRSEKRWRTALLGSLMLLFFALSLMGGGRGELFATLFIVLFIMLRHRPIYMTGTMLCIGLVLAFAVSDWSDLLDSWVIARRLADFAGGDLSSRDSLLLQAGELLMAQPQCLFFGCGPGYFQNYYNYEFSLYPHNVVAESVISYGILITMIFMGFVAIGLVRYWKSVRRIDAFLLMTLFFFIVGMKSGNLFGSWLLVASVFNLAVLAVGSKSTARLQAA
ncbi:O-antigen ligase family protein [Variovorax boronicumulans]|uniref:O-antigen ligase family protein n=1 Tax=Variovorax boronicumulans TaxID=436515 RepID=UPI002783206E|nr:hypothetical protein [Variovorax boronicumulans]MDQ0042710.1 O-antigen ligase [Variovorax boronicumulans]